MIGMMGYDFSCCCGIAPFQGLPMFVLSFDGLHPSLLYYALSRAFPCLLFFRWASPIAIVLRPFRAFSDSACCYFSFFRLVFVRRDFICVIAISFSFFNRSLCGNC